MFQHSKMMAPFGCWKRIVMPTQWISAIFARNNSDISQKIEKYPKKICCSKELKKKIDFLQKTRNSFTSSWKTFSNFAISQLIYVSETPLPPFTDKKQQKKREKTLI